MDSNESLSSTERRLLDEVRKLLGANLADFLFSGLGESSIVHHRSFTARSVPIQADEIPYHFKMTNDSELGLPIGRDPLVLAALLDILWERQPLDSTILFREGNILEKLGWDDDHENHSLIKRALERYAFTAYCLVDPTPKQEESPSNRYASVARLLIGYEMASPLYPLKKRGQPKYATSEAAFACAHFLPGLIQDVISERKNFLGTDFQRLKEIRPQTNSG